MTTETNEGGASGGGKETVLDAINEALGLGGSGDETDTGAGDAGAEDSADLLEAGDDQDAADGAEEADSGDEQGGDEASGDKPAGQGAEAAEGADKSGAQPTYADLVKEAGKLGIQQRNADGTIKSGEQLAAEIAAKSGKQGDPAKGTKKEADALNDPIDKKWGPEVNQRIRTLIDRTKQAEAKSAEIENINTQMFGGLHAAGVSPEQFGETLSFLALFNSGDPKQQTQALELLEGMADRLATLLGVERKTTDPLAQHADLRTEVQGNKLTVERAREIARMRNQGAFRQELTTAAQTSQQQAQQAERELNQAKADLNTLEQTLKQTDPAYARKRAAIVPSLKVAFKRIPPSQWKAAFEEAYRTVRVAAAPKQTTPQNQPMRARSNPAGSGASASGGTAMANGGPKSMFEAMWGHAPKA